MNSDLILGGSFLALTALILLLRTKCNFLVLALCSGYVLANTLQGNLYDLSNKININVPGISLAQLLQLLVTLLPAILVAIRFYKSQRGISLVQQFAPAFATVGLIVVFAQPVLEQSSAKSTLDGSVFWGLFTQYRVWIILFAIGVSLLGILLERSSAPKRGRPRKKAE